MSTATHLVLLQTRDSDLGEWQDYGIPETVEAYDTAYDTGVEFACVNEPNHGNWRVLVWEHAEDGFSYDKPTHTIYPTDLPKTRTTLVRRPMVKKWKPRTRGPVFDVVTKRVAGDDMIKRRVLLTDDPKAAATDQYPGTVWSLAASGERAVSAFVRGYGEMTWRGQHIGSLHTDLGEVRFPVGTAVAIDDSQD